METTKSAKRPHSLTIENRVKSHMTGIEKVISSSETILNLETSEGGLTILGSGFKINKYDLESGVLSFEGTINQIKYTNAKQPLVKRLFK